MKKTFAILFSFFFLFSVFGQKKKLLNEPNHDERAVHFGFCLGLNVMSFVVHPNLNNYMPDSSLIADVSKPSPGFHVQVISNIRLGEYFDLRFLPGVSFGQRNLNFFKKGVLVDQNHKLESNFIELPLLLKYKAKRLNNFRPYVITGPNYRIDLAKTLSEDDGVFIALKRFDIYYEGGVGLDFYMPYFKMSTELKVSYGFNNMLRPRANSNPQYQNSIDRLNSTLWMLSFHFE